MTRCIVIYYIVGPVHLNNLDLIAHQMPDWEFRIAYESHVAWFTTEQMKALKYDVFPLQNEHIPPSLWRGDVRLVVFSSAQLRAIPVSLLQAAFSRGIPTVAIQESNQIALNNGRINNYLLPVDRLLVGSENERGGMVAAGMPKPRIEVTGWPFYTGTVGKTATSDLKRMKADLGLDSDRPVASLTLTALGDAGETPEVRRHLLSIAAKGLPKNYQLTVKPHPIEPYERIAPFLLECSPDARFIPGNVPISQLLNATDVLLNRGVSQVCLEALLKEIPVIVLDTGIQTPFHGKVPEELIIFNVSDLQKALALLAYDRDEMRLYDAFKAEHLPYTPAKARQLVCQQIEDIATEETHKIVSDTQWFDLALFQAWLDKSEDAMNSLEHCRSKRLKSSVEVLVKLMRYQAEYEDLVILDEILRPGFRQAILRSLRVDQLYLRKQKIEKHEIEWFGWFPPNINTSWFVRHARKWATILIRSKNGSGLENYIERIKHNFVHVSGMEKLVSQLNEYREQPFGRIKYYIYDFLEEFRVRVRPYKDLIYKRIEKVRHKSVV